MSPTARNRQADDRLSPLRGTQPARRPLLRVLRRVPGAVGHAHGTGDLAGGPGGGRADGHGPACPPVPRGDAEYGPPGRPIRYGRPGSHPRPGRLSPPRTWALPRARAARHARRASGAPRSRAAPTPARSRRPTRSGRHSTPAGRRQHTRHVGTPTPTRPRQFPRACRGSVPRPVRAGYHVHRGSAPRPDRATRLGQPALPAHRLQPAPRPHPDRATRPDPARLHALRPTATRPARRLPHGTRHRTSADRAGGPFGAGEGRRPHRATPPIASADVEDLPDGEPDVVLPRATQPRFPDRLARSARGRLPRLSVLVLRRVRLLRRHTARARDDRHGGPPRRGRGPLPRLVPCAGIGQRCWPADPTTSHHTAHFS